MEDIATYHTIKEDLIITGLQYFLIDNQINKFHALIKRNPYIYQSKQFDDVLRVAAKHANVEAIKILVSHGANIHTLDWFNTNALFWTLTHCRLDHNSIHKPDQIQDCHRTVKYLLDQGVDCNVIPSSYHNRPILLQLCSYYYYSCQAIEAVKMIIKLLLDNGASSNLVDCFGKTAETIARDRGNDELADYIRDYQPVLYVKGCYGSDD